MTMKVEIVFKGSVLCYLKRGSLHFIFPTDDTHLLNFSHGSGGPSPLRNLGSDSVLEVDLGGTPSQPPTADFTNILNMSGVDFHGSTGSRSNLVENRRRRPGSEIVHMTIPSGRFSAVPSSLARYWSHELGNPQGPHEIGLAAREVRVEIQVDAGKTFSLGFAGGQPPVLSIPYAAGTVEQIILDNDCGAACKGADDFSHYYDWVVDKREPTKFFNAGKMPFPKSSGNEKGIEMLSPQGNCDPVGSDPPPEP